MPEKNLLPALGRIVRPLFTIFTIITLYGFSLTATSVFAHSQNPDNPHLKIEVTNYYGNPLAGTIVILNDDPDFEQVSDSQGSINFQVPEGEYTIRSYKANYLDYTNTLVIEDEDVNYSIRQAEAVYWSTSPADAPIGVGEKNGIRLAATHEKLYLWSAYGGPPGTTDYGGMVDFYEYYPQTDTWTRLPDAPFSSSYGISTAYGKTPEGDDAIYIIKGYWSGQRAWLARYNTASESWEEGLNHEIPWREDLGNQYNGDNFQDYPRNGAVMVYTEDDYIYLLPGSGYSYEKYDWYRYSIQDDQWEALDELPHKQGPGNAAVLVKGENIGKEQDYIYVQFGLTPVGNYTDAEFWRYGLDDQQWEILADHAYGADDGSSLVWDGQDHIYHTPGAYVEQPWDFGTDQKRELMRYSISQNQWEEMEKAPYHRWGGWDDAGGLVLIGDAIYGMKGGDDVAWAEDNYLSGGGDIPSNLLWKFRLDLEEYDLQVLECEGMGTINLQQGSTQHTSGTTIEINATPEPGWEFENWQINQQYYCNNPDNFIIIDKEIQLQAIFSQTTSTASQTHNNTNVYSHKNKIFIELDEKSAYLEVVDLYGRQVFASDRLSKGSHSFAPGLAPGVYIIRISLPHGYVSEKLFLNP